MISFRSTFTVVGSRVEPGPTTWKTLSRGWVAAFVATFLLGLTYAVVLWHAFPAARADIGGDYAYVSWRMAHGEVLYRDLPGYQTPLLYLLGAALWHLWPQPDAFLAFALGTRLATLMGLVALCRACRLSPLLSVGAGAIYVLLPMGFLFDSHFEPNILITLGGVLAVLALTHLSRRRAVVAGAVCGLALMAKLTFAPLAITLAIICCVCDVASSSLSSA
jgi:hypothetical protein